MGIRFVAKQSLSKIAALSLLFVVLPIPGLTQANTSARLPKLSAADKARIFGTPQTWAQNYVARYRTAPAAAQQRILKERADIQTRHKRYTVSFTSASAGAERKFSGLTGLPPVGRRPQPHTPTGPVVQPSCLEETAQPNMPAVDMTDYAIVTPVRDQGACGSCWAFGTTAALETAVLRANGNTPGVSNTALALSEEQVLSCTGPTDTIFGITISGNDCGGGLTSAGANYVQQHNIVTNATWPYAGMTETNQCSRYQSQSTTFRATNWGSVCDFLSVCSTPSLKQAIVDHGSVAVAFNVGGDCNGQPNQPPFCDYSGGIFDEQNNPNILGIPETDHVMQLVGWDDSKGAWRVKNSWGTGWGEDGFAWIAYGSNNIGAYAVWVNAEQYNNACKVQAGLKFTKLTVQITTGGDDARDNSEVFATLNNGFELCLKPSSSGATSHCRLPGNKDQNGANDWGNNYTNPRPQTFNLPAQDESPQTMTITLASHSGFGQSADNWDIQAMTVYGIDQSGGEHRLFNIGNPDDHNGGDCFARLKDSPNSESVTISLDGSNKHTYTGGNANGRVSNCNNNGG